MKRGARVKMSEEEILKEFKTCVKTGQLKRKREKEWFLVQMDALVDGAVHKLWQKLKECALDGSLETSIYNSELFDPEDLKSSYHNCKFFMSRLVDSMEKYNKDIKIEVCIGLIRVKWTE